MAHVLEDKRITGEFVTIDFYESNIIKITFRAPTQAAIEEWRDLALAVFDDPTQLAEHYSWYLMDFCTLDEYMPLQLFKRTAEQLAKHPRVPKKQYAALVLDTSNPLISAVSVMVRFLPRNQKLKIFNCAQHEDAWAWLEATR